VLITVCASAVALSNLVVPGATATAALERLSRDGHKLGRRVIHQLRVLEEHHGRGGQHPGGELVDRILEAGLSELALSDGEDAGVEVDVAAFKLAGLRQPQSG